MEHVKLTAYSENTYVQRTPVSAAYHGPKKIWKTKEMNGSQVSECAPSQNRPQHGEIQQPKRAQYLTHLPLSQYPRFPANLSPLCF